MTNSVTLFIVNSTSPSVKAAAGHELSHQQKEDDDAIQIDHSSETP
jgi:hypothetical protein